MNLPNETSTSDHTDLNLDCDDYEESNDQDTDSEDDDEVGLEAHNKELSSQPVFSGPPGVSYSHVDCTGTTDTEISTVAQTKTLLPATSIAAAGSNTTVIVLPAANGPMLPCTGLPLSQQNLHQLQNQMAAPQLQSALPVSTSQPNYVILAPLHTVSAPLPNAELSIPVLQQIPAISTNELVNVSSDGVAPLSRLTRVPNAARNSAEDSNSGDELMDLEELERFAKHFKQKRIELGFTQGDVGTAIGRSYPNDFSQTTISRFEALNLSFKNMCKLKTLLQRWLGEQEKLPNCVAANSFIDQIPPESLPSKRRKRRTTIEDDAKNFLETYFATNSKPNTEQIVKLAEEHNLEKDVVRVWFCNRRQKAKRLRCCGPVTINPLLSPVYGVMTVSDRVTYVSDTITDCAASYSDNTSIGSGVLTSTSSLIAIKDSNENGNLSESMMSPQGATLRAFTQPLQFHNIQKPHILSSE